jgi:hypothetical protein
MELFNQDMPDNEKSKQQAKLDWLKKFEVTVGNLPEIESSIGLGQLAMTLFRFLTNKKWRDKQPLLQLNRLLIDTQTLPLDQVLKKYQDRFATAKSAYDQEYDQERPYLEFELPEELLTAIDEVVQQIPEEERAGITTSTPLAPSIRVAFGGAFVTELNDDPSRSKGKLHLFMNPLRATVFNSANEEHKKLRKEALRHGKIPKAVQAVRAHLPEFLKSFLQQSKKETTVDLMDEFHTWIATFFAAEYFPQLQLTRKNVKKLRTQPTNAFGAGAVAQILSPLLRPLAVFAYKQGVRSLQGVIANSLQEYVSQVESEQHPGGYWIDDATETAFNKNSYPILFHNILSVITAGTDSVAQATIDLVKGIAEETADAKKKRAELRAVFKAANSDLAEKLEKIGRGEEVALTDEEWMLFTNPDNFGEAFGEYVREKMLQSSPVSFTFKSRLEPRDPQNPQSEKHEQTYIVPIKSTAESTEWHDHNAFGGHGSSSQCTGLAQAIFTSTAILAHVLFQDWTYKEVGNPQKKKGFSGIVHAYERYKVKIKKTS